MPTRHLPRWTGALERTRFAATSHVAYDPLSTSGVTTVVDRVASAHDAGLTEAGISFDALGGKVAEPAPEDTTFVHRRAITTCSTPLRPLGTHGGRARLRAWGA